MSYPTPDMPLSTTSTLSSPSYLPLTPPTAVYPVSSRSPSKPFEPFDPPRPYLLDAPPPRPYLFDPPESSRRLAAPPPWLSRIYADHSLRPTPAAPSSAPPQPLYLGPPAVPIVEEDLVPPENFAVVAKGVYRCGFPKKKNFGFMETLKLKTVLCVAWPLAFARFLVSWGMQGAQLTEQDACAGGIPRGESQMVREAGHQIHGASPSLLRWVRRAERRSNSAYPGTRSHSTTSPRT